MQLYRKTRQRFGGTLIKPLIKIFIFVIVLIIIIFLHNIVNKNEFIILFICILLVAIICIKIYSKSVNKHDAKEIVIDEFLGIYLIIIFSYDFKIFKVF